MAGSDPSFNATEFKDAIRSAMTMGLPTDQGLRATFRWTTDKTYGKPDPTGKPYNWTAAPLTEVVHADVQIPVAVEYGKEEAGTGTDAGRFSNTSAVLTILDSDYALVAGADTVLLNGHTYDIISVIAQGLFDVTVYTVHAQSRSLA